MSKRIINHLIKSIVINPGTCCGYVHHSGIYKNGKVQQLGSNNLRSTYNGECVCFSTHAEMDVIQKVLKGQARTTI